MCCVEQPKSTAVSKIDTTVARTLFISLGLCITLFSIRPHMWNLHICNTNTYATRLTEKKTESNRLRREKEAERCEKVFLLRKWAVSIHFGSHSLHFFFLFSSHFWSRGMLWIFIRNEKAISKSKLFCLIKNKIKV